METDLEIYEWGQLGSQGDQDLAALLDEGDEQLDALTFGLDDQGDDTAFGEPVGRDFDFAGSTSAFLGTTGAQQAGLKQAPSSWLSPASTAAPANDAPTPSGRSLSPWTSLNDDPLLSGRPAPVLPPVQAAPVQQQQQRQFKTLEEVEAELRAQKTAAPAPAAQAPAAGQQMTVEQVEVEMLRQRQAAAAAAQQAQQQQQQQQQPQPQQLPPGMSPQPQFQQPPFPPQGFPGAFPPPPQGGQGFYPPHLLPPHLRAQFPQGLPFPPPGGAPPPGFPGSPGMAAGQLPPHVQQQFQQGHSRPGSLAGVGGVLPPPVPHQAGPGSAAPSPALMRQQLPGGVAPQGQGGFPQPPSGPPTPGPGFPPLGSAPSNVDLMATLFPPLPSQAGPPTVQGVEQQLAALSVTIAQGGQHPSLTGAQLHALLAQAGAAKAEAEKGGEEKEGGEGEGEKDVEERKKAAEELVRKVEERIVEHERMEEARKRKAAKIAAMAKHNNLMSNSDKDFITRIQVSQLVTDDPYADDFYFHIMLALRQSRGLPPPSLGMAGGGGTIPPSQQLQGSAGQRKRGRENAMNRMAMNVQRLVENAKKKNAKLGVEGGAGGTLALDGALGKIATRTRSAPRPLLQVKPSSSVLPGSSSAPAAPSLSASSSQDGAGANEKGPSTGQSLLKGAGLIARTDSPSETKTTVNADAGTGGPLSYRATLTIVEKLYDCVLDLEQLRRIQPSLHANVAGLQQQLEQAPEEGKEQIGKRVEQAQEAVRESEERERELKERLWGEMRVMKALDACTPHPFVSLLSINKGKRILPRAIRHLTPEQTLTLLTLVVATFDTLDVVRDAWKLDQLSSSHLPSGGVSVQERKTVEDKTEALLSALVPPVMAVVGQAPLRLVTGMLGLLMDRNDLHLIVRSKPGLAFLTILLSRAEGIKQAFAASPLPAGSDEAKEVEGDLQTWHRTFTHLFLSLSTPSPPSYSPTPLLSLFPSTRLLASLPFGFLHASLASLRPEADGDDEPVWRFLAALAVCADPEQQQGLVMGVRDKVVENVRAARGAEKGMGGKMGVDQAGAALKIRNVNLLLHALSLDASMIETDD
ncbi:hypothetical protein JCM8547_007066 [Rhodosporidiobolus lusitaniae]